ncbi:MAG: imidazole glycerol phosphate synthase subunit HisH [Dehalococcoidia bacterium]|nr:imidazole glycerol phosphate synthase subunit HisH [Dehalococcoidia bacterium]
MSGLRVAVIDYEAGNLRSVEKALETVGASPLVTSKPQDILAADAVVLPGQGRCDAAMVALQAKELTAAVHQVIRQGKPFFGVCVGLQLLFDSSEEGNAACLGVIPGRVRRFVPGLKVPHMGWNQVTFRVDHPVFAGVPQGSYFYFVHSYYPDPKDQSWVAGTATYGIDFCCAAARGNLVATQFHPEKSGPVGLKLYENFVQFAARVASKAAR